MGSAGRDYHNYLRYYKNNPKYEVVAFTAASQIPSLRHNVFPKILAGKKSIPIHPESELQSLIKRYKIDEVALSYSDLSHAEVIDKASIVLASGADFKLIGPNQTMIKSKKPLIAVCATRTGAGKGTIARKILQILKGFKIKPVILRHPMPYSKRLEEQIVQRFVSYDDLDKNKCTIEEREEYQPYIDQGYTVYAGIDYTKIIRRAERDGKVIVFESGNNDLSFFKPDLYIVVADPLRIDGLYSYPGEANVRLADLIIINKCNTAKSKDISLLIKNIKKINPKVPIIKGNSVISVDKLELIKGKSVLVIEDSPTVTHGSLGYSAGYIAAKKYKAKKIINPKPYAVGFLKKIFKEYPHIKDVLPSTGYEKNELRDLEKTINRINCNTVILGTPCDLTKIIKIKKPIVRVSYVFEEIGKKRLKQFIKKVV